MFPCSKRLHAERQRVLNILFFLQRCSRSCSARFGRAGVIDSTWRRLSFLSSNSVNPSTRALLLEKTAAAAVVTLVHGAVLWACVARFHLCFFDVSVSIVFCRSMNRDVRFLTRVRQEFPVYLRTSAMVYTVQSHRHLSFPHGLRTEREINASPFFWPWP